jgi:hypothetical protein
MLVYKRVSDGVSWYNLIAIKLMVIFIHIFTYRCVFELKILTTGAANISE